MVDDSWGVTPPRGGLRVRTNDSLEKRAAARAKAREARAGERSTLMAGRMEARAALRERETLAREAERAARREAEEAAAAKDPHAAAAKGTALQAARTLCASSAIRGDTPRWSTRADSRIVEAGRVAVGAGSRVRDNGRRGRADSGDGGGVILLKTIDIHPPPSSLYLDRGEGWRSMLASAAWVRG